MTHQTMTTTPPAERGRTSVALASYNGITYISEQLDSLRTQTLPPDEVIIADDNSTDGTYEFCRSYIDHHGLAGWLVCQNPANLGAYQNFRQVIAKCTGDLVFTCDQDDVWLPDKIASMVSVMQARPEISLLVSNYIPTVNGKAVRVPMKNLERDDGTVIPLRLKDSGLTVLRPGCTFCFRREIVGKFSIMDVQTALHDEMLWDYAVVSDSLYLLNRQLIYWRRHEGVATGVSFSAYHNISERVFQTHRAENMYRKFLDASEELGITPANIKELGRMTAFQQRRRKMLGRRSVLMAALFVMMNFRNYPTFRNALSDVYAMLFLRG